VTTTATDSPTVRTREAVRADLLAVFRIEKASFAQPWPYRAFERFLGQPSFLVADTGEVVGYVVADDVPNHGRPLGHIKDIAVDPTFRGQGIGTTLLERALDVLRERRVGSVKLEVRESNQRALSLYRRYGFVHRKTSPGYYANGEDALVLVRELDE
jgi:ribosomal-protein-alanine N-acetyltransferase